MHVIRESDIEKVLNTARQKAPTIVRLAAREFKVEFYKGQWRGLDEIRDYLMGCLHKEPKFIVWAYIP